MGEDVFFVVYQATVSIGAVTLENIPVISDAISDSDYDMIIGMDIIKTGKLTIDSTGGNTVITFTK